MADEQELLKFKLDTSDVEARLRRMQELWAELQRRMATGGDAQAIESQLEQELRAFGRMGEAQGKALTGTQELVRAKEKLGAVLNLTGTALGGFAGQLLSVIDLLTAGTKLTAAFGAALAGIGLATAAWNMQADAIRRVREEQEKLDAFENERRQRVRGETVALADRAKGFGVVGGIPQLAARRDQIMRTMGLSEEMAEQAAIAERRAAGFGMDFDAEAFLAGSLKSGGAQLDGSAADRGVIARMLSIGGGGDARAALRTLGASRAPRSQDELIDDAMARLKRLAPHVGQEPELEAALRAGFRGESDAFSSRSRRTWDTFWSQFAETVRGDPSALLDALDNRLVGSGFQIGGVFEPEFRSLLQELRLHVERLGGLAGDGAGRTFNILNVGRVISPSPASLGNLLPGGIDERVGR